MSERSENTSITKLVKFIRSKNAGPFITTIDIFFEEKKNYQRVKNSGILTKELIAKLYKISAKDVMGPFYVDACRGIKLSFLKPQGIASGDVRCRDIYGAQQHIPLLSIEIP
jgi:hypothetical protein